MTPLSNAPPPAAFPDIASSTATASSLAGRPSCTSVPLIQTRRLVVKVVDCPCGKSVEGDTDDVVVANVEAHISADHPDLVGKYSREQILEMAHEQ